MIKFKQLKGYLAFLLITGVMGAVSLHATVNPTQSHDHDADGDYCLPYDKAGVTCARYTGTNTSHNANQPSTNPLQTKVEAFKSTVSSITDVIKSDNNETLDHNYLDFQVFLQDYTNFSESDKNKVSNLLGTTDPWIYLHESLRTVYLEEQGNQRALFYEDYHAISSPDEQFPRIGRVEIVRSAGTWTIRFDDEIKFEERSSN